MIQNMDPCDPGGLNRNLDLNHQKHNMQQRGRCITEALVAAVVTATVTAVGLCTIISCGLRSQHVLIL